MIKAALLSHPPQSGRGVYLRMDELNSPDQLTNRHLPSITECDLAPNRYVWVPESQSFFEVEFLNRFRAVQAEAVATSNRREKRIEVVLSRKRKTQ